jgi:hypothetical protein
MNTFKLTEQEIKLIPPHSQLNSGRSIDTVEPWHIDSFNATKYIKDLMINRGVKSPKMKEIMTAVFSNVAMHTDNLSPTSCCTLAVMLKGHGELIHTIVPPDFTKTGRLITKSKHVQENEAFYFDFHLPHQWINKSKENCIAILADVDREQVMEMKR